jgi:hypothetical protein
MFESSCILLSELAFTLTVSPPGLLAALAGSSSELGIHEKAALRI